MCRFPYFLSFSPPKPTWLLSLEFLSLQRELDAQHSLRHVLVCIQILSLNGVSFSSPNRKFMGTLLGADSKVPKVRQDFLPCLGGLLSSQIIFTAHLQVLYPLLVLPQETTGTLMDKVLLYLAIRVQQTLPPPQCPGHSHMLSVTYMRPVCRYDRFFWKCSKNILIDTNKCVHSEDFQKRYHLKSMEQKLDHRGAW